MEEMKEQQYDRAKDRIYCTDSPLWNSLSEFTQVISHVVYYGSSAPNWTIN